MDHRWNDSTWRDRAARAERERYGASRIARDPDVEERDRIRLRAEEEARRQRINRSPWDIGVAFYDQRDLYTRNSNVTEDGYGRGPSRHPQEGSYAYHRSPELTLAQHEPAAGDASLYEREAWPWLNYHDVAEDPFFGKLVAKPRDGGGDWAHDGNGQNGGRQQQHPGLWQRLKNQANHITHRAFRLVPPILKPAPGQGRGPKNGHRSDHRILEDVNDALTFRGDLDATDIEVSVKDGEVTLEGTVPDRHSKRIAEEVVEGVRGVHDVHNRLTIRREDPTDANVAFVLPLALIPG